MSVPDPYRCVTIAQKRARAAFEAVIADQARADSLYNALPATENGKIISTDLVRELDATYASTPPGVPRDLAPSWDKAWVYAQDRFDREVAGGGRGKFVRFMAGGWAAGKTRIVEKLRATGSILPDLTWDGTLGDTSWASTQIQSALTQGWRVEVVYVHRNIELAIYGAIERGRSEGRFVPLNELPKNHRSVQSSIAKLIDEFADTISFQLFHNTGSSNIPGIALPFNQESLAPDGALHYSLSYETYYQSAADKIYRSAGG